MKAEVMEMRFKSVWAHSRTSEGAADDTGSAEPMESSVLFLGLMQLPRGWRNQFPAGQAELAGDHGTDTPGVPWGLWEKEKFLEIVMGWK